MDGRFEVYEDKTGDWRWRLVGEDGVPIAWGEGYTGREDAVVACEQVRYVAGRARIYKMKARLQMEEEFDATAETDAAEKAGG